MIEVLSDKTGQLGHLIKVYPTKTGLRCSIAAFRGGLSTLKLPHNNQIYEIKLPDEVRKSATWLTYMSKDDDLDFEFV